ncbi:high affinity immunoglobulin epsilon receptor subunit beta [Erinaceus europaeus]|uniref:high affinity immunoglobulin epsilon receptor subunit beta n=1 Tax=Erinaceus europaeus TaxID=9365 RepID=UPI00044491C2|nr:high affinity immunoglobulin epsilon receptor subunit beta [Erinaceus europaeus]
MDTEHQSREDLALPNPQWPSSVPGIEPSEAPSQSETLLEKPPPPPPRKTWLTFLHKELEFLGVTQILIGSICLCFGLVICCLLSLSELQEELLSSFKLGYPIWGAIFFTISGILSIVSEKKNKIYLVQGSLGANTICSITAVTGIIILIINLKQNTAFIYNCQKTHTNDFCLAASFSTEIVAIILLLTILGFCCAVSLTIYRIGEILEKNKIPEDRLYEELNIYSPIYSELEDRGEKSAPTDS